MDGAAIAGIVLEVGPAMVRVPGDPPRDDGRVLPALAALDDPVALIDGRPVEVTELWHRVLADALGARAGPATLVYPSWWPPRRVRRVVAAAARPSVAMTRAEVLRRAWPRPVVVVEFAAEVVAVTGASGAVRVLARADLAGVAGEAVGEHTVLLDAPDGVAGAAADAAAVRALLAREGCAAHPVDLAAWLSPTTPAARPRRMGLPVTPVAAAVAAVAAVSVVPAVLVVQAVSSDDRPSPPRLTGAPPATLVEGRIAVDVPAGWAARRVTDGPGSRRVEVVSPSDPAVVVHITGAYAPGTTVADTARVLARAVAAAPAGVFADFRGDLPVAGRAAVTYTERRPEREVRWTVVVDGAMRISIGCQNPRGGPEIGSVCEAAVRSARDTGAF